MKLRNSLWGRTGQIVITAMLTGLVFCVFLPILRPDSQAASASRARAYSFRHTDSKLATEWIRQLGMKVTVDAHSPSVVVLTSDDPVDLAKAYALVELSDRKEPMQFKTLGAVADSEAKSTLEALNKKLKDSVPGTLMDPPARNMAKPIIVDIYRGELVVFGGSAEIEAAEKARQTQQPKAEPKKVEPNEPAAVKKAEPNEPVAAAPKTQATEPNATPTVQSVEPNAAVVEVESPAEPNVVIAEAKPAAEPNQAVEKTQTSEEFLSEELLKTLTDEERSQEQKVQEVPAEPVKTEAVAAEPNIAKPAEPNAIEPNVIVAEAEPAEKPTAEIPADANVVHPADANVTPPVEANDDAAFKAIIGRLRKQSQDEEKKAMEEPAAVEPNKAEQPVAVEPNRLAVDTQAPAKTKKSAVAEKVKPAVAKTEKMEEELEVTITMPEKVEVQQLIELVGKQLGLNYVYDPTQVTGSVTLKVHDGRIKVKDCYALLESVLRFKGLVMTRRGNLVTIVPQAQSGQLADPKLRREGEPIEAGDVIVSSVFALKYANLNSAVNFLQRMGLGQNPPPILVPETNTLIVTDYANRMPKIEEVIRIIDTPGIKKYVHRQLQFMQASELLPRLQKLASQLQNLNIAIGTTAAPAVRVPGQPAQPGQPQPQPQPQMPQQVVPQDQITVYLDADERTNRVLMIGNEEQIAVVNTLIDSLDVKQYDLRYVKEYEIKNVDAGEVISALNELGLAKISTASTSTTPTTSRSRSVPGQPLTPQQQQQQQQQQAMAQMGGGAAAGETGADQPFISIRPNTNSLLVNATAEQHERIELVIRYIDVEQKDQRTIKEYEIQNIDASEVVQTLGDLGVISSESVSTITTSKDSMYGGGMGYGSSRYGSSYGSQYGSQYGAGMNRNMQGMQGMPGMEQQSGATNLITAEGTEKELTAAEPKISILENTNSLLVHATPRQHASVALVIAYVDRQLDQASTPYVVYPLENQKPEDLRTTLEGLIQESLDRAAKKASASAQDPRLVTTQQPTGGESELPFKKAEKIRIVDDEKSNSIIVYANKKNQQWISELIKELDAYRPQVLLDCTLVKIKQDEAFTYDLDIIGKTYGGATMQGATVTDPLTGEQTFSTIVGSQGDFTKNPYIDARSTNGTGKVFFNSDRVQALLDVVESKGYGRIMSRPKILVNDNEEGIVKTINTIGIPQVKVITTPYSTGSGTSSTTSNDVEFIDYEAGVELKIKPHISKGDMLRLEIGLKKTLFTLKPDVTIIVDGETNRYPSPPDRATTDVNSIATVPDGSTIVLGGLEEIDQQKGNTKVPILGDLPIVGGLFRSINNTGTQDRLYIFVKANVIRPSDQVEGLKDIKRVSDKYRKSYEKMESDFQKMQSWPGIKDKPMEPTGVLEDDETTEQLRNELDSEDSADVAETSTITGEKQ